MWRICSQRNGRRACSPRQGGSSSAEHSLPGFGNPGRDRAIGRPSGGDHSLPINHRPILLRSQSKEMAARRQAALEGACTQFYGPGLGSRALKFSG